MFHKHYFQFLLGITVILREIDDNGYAKFGGVGGVNKEHYGLCENGDKAGLYNLQATVNNCAMRHLTSAGVQCMYIITKFSCINMFPISLSKGAPPRIFSFRGRFLNDS